MVIKALLEGSIEGVGQFHKTPIFPCGIFQMMSGVNRKEGDPNYDLFKLALKSTSQRLYPNYANCDWTGNEGYDKNDPKTYFSTMGCHAYDTPIIMADGTKKMVQDIIEGDKVMGADGTPRTVQSLIRGNDKLFKIKQSNGCEYTVNEGHILALQYDSSRKYKGFVKGDRVNMSVHDYMRLPKYIRPYFRGYKGSYDLDDKDFGMQPYNLGLKLGDESTIEAQSMDKHIPMEYFCGSRKQRSELLAGLINANGFAGEDIGGESICFRTSNHDLLIDAQNLANTIGCQSRIIEYEISPSVIQYNLIIYNFNDDKLSPSKRANENVIAREKFGVSVLEIEEVGNGDFYGFELDGDRLYLFNDCTVTHNCRTANGFDINGFGQLKDGRGNICPVTVIMPTLAMEALEKVNERAIKEERKYSDDEVVEEFIKILTKKIEEAKDMLIERFDWICSQSPASAKFMWENNTMAGYVPEEGIRSALKHGTLALGQIGLAETLQILIHTDHTTQEGMELAKRIEQLFNEKVKGYKEKYKLNFGVYYTPAENLCHTALKKFKDKYGIIPNVSDREYFTNSMHVPVWHDMTPFEKIDIEAQLTSYSNAGCITYVELPSTTKYNIEALEEIVQYAMDKNIPYFAVNVPVDTCQKCGYSDEMGETCPICGSDDIQRLRRITGYLTGNYTTAFNKGKIQETEQRVKHIKKF